MTWDKKVICQHRQKQNQKLVHLDEKVEFFKKIKYIIAKYLKL
jgi:hypothetical protein